MTAANPGSRPPRIRSIAATACNSRALSPCGLKNPQGRVGRACRSVGLADAAGDPLKAPLLVGTAVVRPLNHAGAVGGRPSANVECLAAVTGEQTSVAVAGGLEAELLAVAAVVRPQDDVRA